MIHRLEPLPNDARHIIGGRGVPSASGGAALEASERWRQWRGLEGSPHGIDLLRGVLERLDVETRQRTHLPDARRRPTLTGSRGRRAR